MHTDNSELAETFPNGKHLDILQSSQEIFCC